MNKFTLSNELLEPAIIIKSLHDKSFFLKIKKYLDTTHIKGKSYFNDEKLQKIFNVISKWYDKYAKFPREKELKILFSKMEKDEEIRKVSLNLIDDLYNGDPNEIEEKFLSEEVKRFIEETRVYEAIMESQIDLQEGNFSSIVTRIQDAVSVNFDTNLGFSIKDIESGLKSLQELEDESTTCTGFPSLDKILDPGMRNGEIYVFSGIPSIGKTALLGNFAINGLLDNKNVIVFTLETHTKRLISRYYANLLKSTKKELLLEGEEIKEDFKELMKDNTGDIIIKEYNANSVSSNDLAAYLNDLTLYKGFKPHIIVVDYLLLMQTNDIHMSRDNSYKYYKTVTEELRNLASDFNVPLLTASQINRHGQDEHGGSKRITTSKDVSESRGILDTADFFATINQTNKDREKSELVLYIDKWRNGEKGEKINCEFDYKYMIIKEK